MVFENVRFQPSTHNKYGKSEFSKIWIAGLRVEGSPTRQKNKQTIKQTKTQSCGQKLTEVNASKKKTNIQAPRKNTPLKKHLK